MPHRDDSEAARAHIEALERELAETRERAEAAEASARAARAALKPEPEPSKRAKKRDKTKQEKKRARDEAAAAKAASTTKTPAWPDEAVARYRRSIGVLTAVAYAPVAWSFLAAPDDLPLVALRAALLVVLVLTYVIGRACGAPYPSSPVALQLLVCGPILLGLFLASSDVFLGSLFSDGLLHWIVRGGLAITTLVVGGIVSGTWCSDAARSDIGVDRDRYRR